MIALRIRSPKGAEQPLELAPGHHTAGGATSDAVPLDGLAGAVLEIDSSDQTAIVVARIAGVLLGTRVLKAGERWLLRGGQSVIVRGYEIRRQADAALPARPEGTAALARGMLGASLGSAVASPLPTLVWLNGRDCGKRHPLLDEATFLGRGDGTGARVRDALASRAHARIAVKDGAAKLFDLESANGLFVDGLRVQEQRDLVGGEVIRIGETELLFEAALPRPAPRPAPADARGAPLPPTQKIPAPVPARKAVGLFELAVIGAASATGAAVTAAVWLLAR